MKAARVAMGLFYMAAGVAHFLLMRSYERAAPRALPAHGTIVVLSGVAEIAGGAGVLVPQTRRAAAWGIIVLLVAVFPANVSMALRHAEFPQVPGWALWARLPLQGVLIWWAWRYARPQSDASSHLAQDTAE